MARTARRRVLQPKVLAGLTSLAVLLALTLPDCFKANQIGRQRAAERGDLRLGPAPRRAPQAERFARACPGRPVEPARDAEGVRVGPILRSPYVQRVGSAEAELLWTSEPLADPVVAVWRPGTTPSLVRPAIDREARLPRGVQYAAGLRGLEPGAIHCYAVRDGERVLAGPFGFSTAPAAGSGQPIRLVAFGDMGYPTPDQTAVKEQMSRVEFDLALLAGDIAYPRGRLVEYEDNFLAPYASLMRSAVFFPASGNHDYQTDDAAPFRQVFALPENGGPAGRERWYSFDWGDLHVVVLDSERRVPEQTAWLDADLTDHAGARWTLALVHRAPYSSGEHGPDLATREAFVPILTRHRVPLVIAGHEHNYERFEPIDGVTHVVTGGGGRGTRRVTHGRPGSALAAQVAHFLYLVIEGDRLRLWAVDATGQTFDTLELVRFDPAR